MGILADKVRSESKYGYYFDEGGKLYNEGGRYSGAVFYHKDEQQFFQVRETHPNYLIVSHFCNFFADARTNLIHYRVTPNILMHSVLITDPKDWPDYCTKNNNIQAWSVINHKTYIEMSKYSTPDPVDTRAEKLLKEIEAFLDKLRELIEVQ